MRRINNYLKKHDSKIETAIYIFAIVMLILFMNKCSNLSDLEVQAGQKKTIVTFGDSTTAKYGTEYIYSDILRNETQYNVINSGVPGNTTDMASVRFKTDVLDHKPDVLIIQFGINDSAVDIWKTPAATSSRVSIDQYQSNIESFITQAQAIGTRVILMTPNSNYWTPHWLSLFGGSPYDPNSSDGMNVILKTYAQRMRDIAAKYNLTLIDVYAAYALYSDPLNQLLDDGIHPNNAGHRLVATMIEAKL